MLKKLFIAALLGALAVVSASAQTRVDNFLGTWKMTKTEGFPKGTTINSMILKVSDVGGELTIVKETEGVSSNKQNYSTTRTAEYKLSGASTTNIVPGQYGGVLVSYLDILGKNKLRLRDMVQNTGEQRTAIFTGGTEYWTLSDDGKTLTVEIRTAYNSSRVIYSKQ